MITKFETGDIVELIDNTNYISNDKPVPIGTVGTVADIRTHFVEDKKVLIKWYDLAIAQSPVPTYKWRIKKIFIGEISKDILDIISI